MLSIKIETPKSSERKEDKEEGKTSLGMGAMGVVLLSKKKTKDWLNVPVKAKKTPLFPVKEPEFVPVSVPVEEVEEEEILEDPVIIRGAKVNLLGKY